MLQLNCHKFSDVTSVAFCGNTKVTVLKLVLVNSKVYFIYNKSVLNLNINV